MFAGMWFVLAWLASQEPVDVDPPNAAQQQLLFNLSIDYCPHDFMRKCPPWVTSGSVREP